MQNFMTKLALLAASISLVVSCSSTNTQSENTAIGAATGAVIGGVAGSAIGAGTGQAVAVGVGVAAGALIGGAVGHSMDHTDYVQVNQTFEHNHKHKGHHWKNKKTGHHYTVIPTSERMAFNGNQNCRSYHSLAWIDGKKHSVDGTACRQDNGSWATINS